MNRQPLTYRNAFILSVAITVVLQLLFIIVFLYGRETMTAEGLNNMHPPRTLDWRRTLLISGFNLLLCFILYVVNFKFLRSRMRTAAKITITIIISILITLVLSYIHTQTHFALFDHGGPGPGGPHPGRIIRGNQMRDLTMALIVVLTSQLMYISHRKQVIALENEKLKAENASTRFQALKNQLDPHFLFNSLNTLNSIITIDPLKAQEYLQELSSVFRYTLQTKEIITLNEELNFTRAYCHLMSIRYGDSLNFYFDIEEGTGDRLVLPLSIQSLVENAIKHNVITRKNPFTVTIRGGAPYITVSNPIREKKVAEAGEGIGLANLAERYRLIWQEDIKVQQSDGNFAVTLPTREPQNLS